MKSCCIFATGSTGSSAGPYSNLAYNFFDVFSFVDVPGVAIDSVSCAVFG